MKMIPLTQGKFAQVSDHRFDYLNQWKWYAMYVKRHDLWYAARAENKSKTNPKKKTIFYAPTWKDAEKSSSFEEVLEKLTSNSSKDFNIIIKLHPNFSIRDKIKLEKTVDGTKIKNIIILDDFPSIYPLLNFSDIYLGDFSSIGYDFLYFNKPMFFLRPSNKNLYSNLYTCGEILDSDDFFKEIKSKLKDDEKYRTIRKQLYAYTFKKVNFLKEKPQFI